MGGPDDPTVPPPPRRRPPSAERLPPPPPAASEAAPEPKSKLDSNSRELVLGRIEEVELRAQTAVSELMAAYERRFTELQKEIAVRDALIERLQRAQTEASSMDMQLSGDLAQLSRDMRVEIQRAVENTLAAKASAAGADSGSTAARSESKTTRGWSAVIATVTAGIISGALTVAQRSCNEPPHTMPAPNVLPLPQPNPNNYAGKP